MRIYKNKSYFYKELKTGKKSRITRDEYLKLAKKPATKAKKPVKPATS